MDRHKVTKKVGTIGIIGNIFLLIIKVLTGFTYKSQTMIAEALNSAGDIFSSLMTTIGNKIASRPRDDTHNLGHGKAEYVFSMLISIAMVLTAGKLLIDNILLIINNDSTIQFSYLLVVTSVITIIVKFSLYMYTRINCKKINNILLKANEFDHRNDIFVALLTLISLILSKYGIQYVDSIGGILISTWIGYTGVKIFLESYDILMDKALDKKTIGKIKAIVKKHKEIKKIQHLNSTPIGLKYMVSISIFVDGNMSTYDSHKIADQLEDEINELEKVEVTIVHVNPI